MSKYGLFSSPYFPAFGLNTERYFVFLRVQSESGKTRTRKNFIFGHFSRSVKFFKSHFVNNFYKYIHLLTAALQADFHKILSFSFFSSGFTDFFCLFFLDFPVDTGRKLKVHKTFRRRPGRLLNVLCKFNLRPASTDLFFSEMSTIITVAVAYS